VKSQKVTNLYKKQASTKYSNVLYNCGNSYFDQAN